MKTKILFGVEYELITENGNISVYVSATRDSVIIANAEGNPVFNICINTLNELSIFCI